MSDHFETGDQFVGSRLAHGVMVQIDWKEWSFSIGMSFILYSIVCECALFDDCFCISIVFFIDGKNM